MKLKTPPEITARLCFPLALLSIAVVFATVARAQETEPFFDMDEMRNVDSLDVQVLQDWHRVTTGDVMTRQKVVTIRVGELLPDREYRVPVRFIVPVDQKAKGFYLTGSHHMARFKEDVRLRPDEVMLIEGGVGVVHTMVQDLRMSEQSELGRDADRMFIETLNPRYSIQYWGWPATLMRTVTAAYAEEDHFEVGKVALSGGSKNGASPSMAIIHDERMTAVNGHVSPIWDSPLRLCDKDAWDQLQRENGLYLTKRMDEEPAMPKSKLDRLKNHMFLGGTFGPIYTFRAIRAGHSWKDVQQLAETMADNCFISRNLEQLKAREVDMLFEPGSHDYVAYDLAWGGKHFPQIPIFIRPNSGHGTRDVHPGAIRGVNNMRTWLLEHFFDTEPLLSSPTVNYEIDGGTITVSVKFPEGSVADKGRIYWMFDRGPDGSIAYLEEKFLDDEWDDMEFDSTTGCWTFEIDYPADAERIDFFSSHFKRIEYQSRRYTNCISSPYTRVEFPVNPK